MKKLGEVSCLQPDLGLHQNLIMLVSKTWTSTSRTTSNKFLLLFTSHSTHGILLEQPDWITHTHPLYRWGNQRPERIHNFPWVRRVSRGVKGFKTNSEEPQPHSQLGNTASHKQLEEQLLKGTALLSRSSCLRAQLCPDTKRAFQGWTWHESDEGRARQQHKLGRWRWERPI